MTVAGESAGAMSVTTLLAMPSAEGLFAQAITQSGAAAHTLTPQTGATVAATLAEALGVAPTREAIAGVELDLLVKAASDLVVEVQTAPDPAKWGSLALSLLPFAPVVDGTVLPAHPLEAFAAGAASGVPVLLGSNRDEARLFLVAAGAVDLVDEPTLAGGAGAYGLSPDGLELYRGNRPDASPGDVLAAVVTDWFFAVPAIRHAEARAAGGGTTWAYRFDRPPPADNGGLGAAHAVEIPYVFGTAHLPSARPLAGATPSPDVVADRARASGWPSCATATPGWAPYTAGTRTTGVHHRAAHRGRGPRRRGEGGLGRHPVTAVARPAPSATRPSGWPGGGSSPGTGSSSPTSRPSWASTGSPCTAGWATGRRCSPRSSGR